MTTLPSPPANRPRHTFAWLTLGAASLMVVAACTDLSSDSCEDLLTCCADGSEPPCETGSGGTGAGASDGGGATTTANGGAGGTGGAPVNCIDEPGLCTGATPACNAAGECVQCTDNSTCDGTTPICNTDDEECAPCSFHNDCPTTACNIFTGACLEATPITVGPDAGDDHADISSALATIPSMGVGVIRLKAQGSAYNEMNAVNIAGGRTVAILAEGAARPRWTEDDGSTTLTIAANATVFVQGVEFSGNTAGGGVTANGNLALDQVDIRSNTGGSGIVANDMDADIRIRNSIIAGNQLNAPAIALGNANIQLLYSSVASANTTGNASALLCTGIKPAEIRNSILFTESSGQVDTISNCATTNISNTAFDDDFSFPGGSGNVGFTVDAGLFTNINNGNLRLTMMGAMGSQFGTVASWRTGDPTDDIDGTPRPAATMGDMTPDVAGAHLGP